MAEKMPGVCVIGAGMCGNAAALKLVQEGVPVTLIDRGSPIGSKNISGGVLWGRDLEEVLPRFWEEMPYERSITSKRISFLTEKSGFTVEYKNAEWRQAPFAGFSVLRAKVDKWLSDQVTVLAEQRSMADQVNVIEGVLVEGFSYDEHKNVKGIIQGGEELEFDAFLLCDGANSRLLDKTPLVSDEQRALGRGYRKYKMAVQSWGAKVIIQLDEKTVEDRFNLMPGDGVANEMSLGFLPKGIMSGGFMYSNRDTVSLGIVLQMHSAWDKKVFFRDIMDAYIRHPYIQGYVKGGEEVEYATHWVPEGGLNWMPDLYGERLLVGGDTAQMVFASGLNLEGMNYAVKSGLLAGATFADAWKSGKNFSKAAMEAYERRLWNSFVLQDLAQFRDITKITGNSRIFNEYPQLIDTIFKGLVWPTGLPKKTYGETMMLSVLRSGVLPNLIGDGAQAAMADMIPAMIARMPIVGPILTKELVSRRRNRTLRKLYREMEREDRIREIHEAADRMRREAEGPAKPAAAAAGGDKGGAHA